MHCGKGWITQNHGCGLRNHFQSEQAKGTSIIMIFVEGIVTAGLIFNNFIGIGLSDDPLLVGSSTCFAFGRGGLTGKKNCTECGALRYGY